MKPEVPPRDLLDLVRTTTKETVMSTAVPHLNVVIAAGRCTHDPNIKYSDTAVPYCDWQLAVKTRRYIDGKPCYRTSFVQVTAVGKTAEFVERHLSTGTPVVVRGQLHEVTWPAGGRLQRRVKLLADAIERLEIAEDVGSEPSSDESDKDGAKDGGPASSADAGEATPGPEAGEATPGPEAGEATPGPEAGEDDPDSGAGDGDQ